MLEPRFSPNGIKVLSKQKYLWPLADGTQETPAQLVQRVATFIAKAETKWGTQEDADELANIFYEMMAAGRFIPNSPTLGNAGKEKGQLAACFVLPIDDSIEAIYDTLKLTAIIQASGGGTGFSGARLRPKGSPVGTTGKVSDGNIPFIELYNFSSKRVLLQGSARKGANMWIIPIDHPDIEEFIDLKKDPDSPITQFNISVGMTDAFMRIINGETPTEEWHLRDPRDGHIVKTVSASQLFNKIIDNAWAGGDPGLFFINRANRDNPTPQVGKYEATNPCGEQPLLPYEACTLGHLNLGSYFIENTRDDDDWQDRVNWSQMQEDIYYGVRFLDNVVELNWYPLQQIERMHRQGNRKIGLGVMGFADLLIKLGIPYSSPAAIEVADKLGMWLRKNADEASVELAQTRGSFGNFNGSAIVKQFPKGKRNACTVTIAPTGTTGIILGASTSVEPVFGLVIVRQQAGMVMNEVHPLFDSWLSKYYPDSKQSIIEYVAKNGTILAAPGVSQKHQVLWAQANDILWEQHVAIQAAWQKHIDSAVSKTINMQNSASRDDVRHAYIEAWASGCKGITVYRDGSKTGQAITVKKEDSAFKPQAEADLWKKYSEAVTNSVPPKKPTLNDVLTDLDLKRMFLELSDEQLASLGLERIKPKVEEPDVPMPTKERSRVTNGSARKIPTGCGNAFIFIGNGNDGKVEDVMGRLGKSGGCAAAWWEAMCRVTSLAARSGVDIADIQKQLAGISCHLPVSYRDSPFRLPDAKPPVVTSCADALAKALAEHAVDSTKTVQVHDSAKVESTTITPFTPPTTGWTASVTTPVKATYGGMDKHAGACPSCGSSSLDHGGGCVTCMSCGYSRC